MLPRRMHVAIALPTQAAGSGGGGIAYIHGLAAALRGLGVRVDLLEGDSPVFPPGVLPIIDGMLLPTLAPRLDELVSRDAVALMHRVSAQAGRDPAAREAVQAIERQMLPALRRVIATSAPVAERLQHEFGVEAPHVVAPGAADLPRAAGSGEPGCRILSVGVLTPRKGHDRLLRALVRLMDLDWTLLIAGSAGRDPVHAAGLAALITELGLDRRATLLRDPEPDALEAAWRGADLFALATCWEDYPAAVAEALRRGLPAVVTDAAGALPPPEAAAVCALDDAATLSKCLRRMVFDRALREDMAKAAWTAGQALPGWPDRAREFDAILRS